MAENLRRADLRYLDASRVADARLNFDGLDVRNARGEKLGSVDGFVVQRDTNRPYYLVVDSGGWFTSRHYLLPVGHVRLDPDNGAFRVDVDKDTIKGFPEVDIDRFDQLTEDDAIRFNERTLTACCPNEVAARTGDKWDYDQWSHYRQPDWWHLAPMTEPPPPPLTNRPMADDYDPTLLRNTPAGAAHRTDVGEQVIARAEDEPYGIGKRPGRDDRPVIHRDDNVAPSRTLGEGEDRAQPGDVLGIETAGETTSLGDTADDEDKRREDAEDANREILDDQRRERPGRRDA
jgi:hypothetical protein